MLIPFISLIEHLQLHQIWFKLWIHQSVLPLQLCKLCRLETTWKLGSSHADKDLGNPFSEGTLNIHGMPYYPFLELLPNKWTAPFEWRKVFHPSTEQESARRLRNLFWWVLGHQNCSSTVYVTPIHLRDFFAYKLKTKMRPTVTMYRLHFSMKKCLHLPSSCEMNHSAPGQKYIM